MSTIILDNMPSVVRISFRDGQFVIAPDDFRKKSSGGKALHEADPQADAFDWCAEAGRLRTFLQESSQANIAKQTRIQELHDELSALTAKYESLHADYDRLKASQSEPVNLDTDKPSQEPFPCLPITSPGKYRLRNGEIVDIVPIDPSSTDDLDVRDRDWYGNGYRWKRLGRTPDHHRLDTWLPCGHWCTSDVPDSSNPRDVVTLVETAPVPATDPDPQPFRITGPGRYRTRSGKEVTIRAIVPSDYADHGVYRDANPPYRWIATNFDECTNRDWRSQARNKFPWWRTSPWWTDDGHWTFDHPVDFASDLVERLPDPSVPSPPGFTPGSTT